MGKPYRDKFCIGQAACAQNAAEVAFAIMERVAPEIIETAYVPDMWRAMRARQLTEARAEYDRALAVIEAAK